MEEANGRRASESEKESGKRSVAGSNIIGVGSEGEGGRSTLPSAAHGGCLIRRAALDLAALFTSNIPGLFYAPPCAIAPSWSPLVGPEEG